MRITKRSGAEVEFEREKIRTAVTLANGEVAPKDRISDRAIQRVTDAVVAKCEKANHVVSVEEVQDMVENELIEHGSHALAKHYIVYRYEHQQARQLDDLEKRILSIVNDENTEAKGENGNKDPRKNSTLQYYLAGTVCKDIARKAMIPADIVKAHDEGIIHFHDMDVSPVIPEHNCGILNVKDMFENGTVMGDVRIDTPKSLSTAATLMTQIVMNVSSNQYGGLTISLAHLAPFVDVSRKKYHRLFSKYFADAGIEVTDEQLDAICEDEVDREIKDSIQCLNYQLNTLSTAQGQSPFVSLFMYIKEAKDGQEMDDLNKLMMEVFRQREAGFLSRNGHVMTQTFPKLLYVLTDNNTKPGDKYYQTTLEAVRCVNKRMNPDFVSEKVMREQKEGMVVSPMGCRSLLSPYFEADGTPKLYGRGNMGVVTINLVDVALSSGGDMDRFWDIMEERLELCHRALRLRYERLKDTPSDVAPILWQYGAYARLKPGETLDKILVNGNFTISLGYAGLYNCVKYMTGVSQFEEGGHEFGLKVMQALNNHCDKWKKEEHLGYSVYGTPIESTTYKFAKCLQKRFGIVDGVDSDDYIINSYHYPVKMHVDAFKKLSDEFEFQKLSLGGAVSYVELPDMSKNLEALQAVIEHIYDTMLYAECNLRNKDLCLTCGFEGELKAETTADGKIEWVCPKCGERRQTQLSVVRRLCGYLPAASTAEVKAVKGRTEDILDRVLHL